MTEPQQRWPRWKRRAAIILLLAAVSLPAAAGAGDAPPRISVIPRPLRVSEHPGSFRLDQATKIVCESADSSLQAIAATLAGRLRRATGFELPVVGRTNSRVPNSIELRTLRSPDLGGEGYTLEVDPRGVRLAAHAPAGLFYAVQTLCQLLPPEVYGRGKKGDLPWHVPCVSIYDKPRFSWRGMHLDVCRHFFPKEFVEKYIDELAMYKMNTFHWHLTDDQGWRIEIRKHPRLTSVGAWRSGSMVGSYSDMKFDSIRYGGYYTQEEIREVVAYAASRYVTVVPEIEMPGHALAALASHPELSCTGGPFEVGERWGVYDDVFCPKESTFAFLEEVLAEVCSLFPGTYIHIGGDECPKVRWKECAACQALMKNEGLKNEEELQSYFVRRIETFLNGKGKQIIGWDEILEGGLAPNAAVMSWRGTDGGLAAAKQHHGVVMTPGDYCYFDHYQGDPKFEPLAIGGYTTLAKVYSYEPVPPGLPRRDRRYIMGAQGNVWTEYILSPQQVEYMALPRMAALAEVVWSPATHRNLGNFERRLVRQFAALDSLNITYSRSLYEIQSAVKRAPHGGGIVLELSSPFGPGGIRYTLDGSDPAPGSRAYKGAIAVKNDLTVRYAYLRQGKRQGNILSQQFVVTKSTGKKIRLKTPPDKKYSEGGPFTLVDGKRGNPAAFGMGWLGFWGPDLDAVIDLGYEEACSSVALGTLQNDLSWIYYPKSVEVLVSDDNVKFTSVGKAAVRDTLQGLKEIDIPLGGRRARYIRVVAKNAGKIPEGKPGAGSDSWLFVDEIRVR